MGLTIQINTGFVTNSSSTIFFYDKTEIMNNPGAMAYIRMLGLESGFEVLGRYGLSRSAGDCVVWNGGDAARESDIDQDVDLDDIDIDNTVISYESDEVGETIASKFNNAMAACGIHPILSTEVH